MRSIIYILLLCCLFSCSKNNHTAIPKTTLNNDIQQRSVLNTPKILEWEIVSTIPHDPTAYTQGLIYYDGVLYESTGLEGKSTLRKINLKSGNIEKIISIPDSFFGEGITIFENYIYMLTWQSQLCLVINLETFKIIDTFPYNGQGWGLTNDSTHLIMSDGTNIIKYIEPNQRNVSRTLSVTYNSKAFRNLNELEFVKDKIWSNIYGEDKIAVINPDTGEVEHLLDFSELRKYEEGNYRAEVFNGIAYDAENDIYYLTGKYWKNIFKIKLK